MGPATMAPVPTKMLARIWAALPRRLGAATGETASLGKPEIADAWTPEGKRYYAELELVEPSGGKLWLSVELAIAIAVAGGRLGRPRSEILDNISTLTFQDAELEEMDECVETLCATMNEELQRELGDRHRVAFSRATLEPPTDIDGGPLARAHARLELDTLTSGELELVVPTAVFAIVGEDADADSEAPVASEHDDGLGRIQRPAAQGRSPDEGPLLTPEEMAAIRDATKAMGAGKTLIVAQQRGARERWRDSIAEAGIEDMEVCASEHQLLAACREQAIETLVIDADACSSGGLGVLAAVRTLQGGPERRVVLASQPTRSHLVACVAGGATDYLAEPADADELRKLLTGG